MPTFTDPATDAAELREAVRALAHATRSIDDPSSVYPVLGDLTAGLSSLSQALHQIGDFHDGPARNYGHVGGSLHAGRAASYQEAWELHRAAEMLHQVAECVARAHAIEATIAYEVPDPPPLAPAARPSPERRLSL